MLKRLFNSKTERGFPLVVSGLGMAHFAISSIVWLWGISVSLKIGGSDWNYILHRAPPAFLLLAAFITTFIFTWKSRKLAVRMTLLSLAASILCFGYDTRHNFYQIQANELGKGCSHLYFTWWWYDDIRNPNR